MNTQTCFEIFLFFFLLLSFINLKNHNSMDSRFSYYYNTQNQTNAKHVNLGTGFVTKVSDEIVHCIGLPNVKLGEVVFFFSKNRVVFKGLVINVS